MLKVATKTHIVVIKRRNHERNSSEKAPKTLQLQRIFCDELPVDPKPPNEMKSGGKALPKIG